MRIPDEYIVSRESSVSSAEKTVEIDNFWSDELTFIMKSG